MHPNVHCSTIYNSQDMEDVEQYYSAIKKNEIMPFAATWMDLEIIILSQRRIPYDITYMWNL